ncbi:MAG: MATE family efflux transporter [Prevotella sp.]|nr:MATE family efflux transporter [Prevotella sp.]
MSDTSATNKRIAKNTLMLYVRMLFTMGVSLFTSRVVLQTLGVEDYGINSVVGGVITMFTFINGAMVSSTQRYLNFELARGNAERLRSVFNTSLQIHALIALAIVLLGETVGLWFLKEKLVIPEARMTAAMWVYQCSILSCAVGIMSAPYNADIIAHEKMSAFAYISILDVSLKLLIVYLLVVLPFDKLIVMAVLTLLVQLLIRYIYSRYCHTHFKETYFQARIDKPLFKEMSGFAGWSFWGNLAVILYTQGLNMMLNIFFGPIVNAARGIAVQVQSAVQQFVSGFQTALNPQITKNYASGNLEQMHSLMFRSARFSFLLLFFLSLPVLLETDFLLTLWLKTVPDDAVFFTQIMICISLIYTTTNPCVVANQATGKVKIYQMVVGGILLMILPISYISLKLGAPAYSVFIVHFCVESVAQFSRMYMLRKLINLPMWQYMKNIYIPIVTTVAVAIILPIIVRMQVEEGWLRFIAVGFTCVLSVGLSTFFIGFTKHERVFFLDKGLRIIKIRR